MAEFKVEVVKIDDVVKHPEADRLTIVSIGGYKCIANLNDDGSWRYNADDLVVYIPESAVLPEWLLKKMGFWDNEKNKGTLSGSKGDRVKCAKLRGIISQGILYAVEKYDDETYGTDENGVLRGLIAYKHSDISDEEMEEISTMVDYLKSIDPTVNDLPYIDVILGEDVAETLGITKYEPPIPQHMSGEVTSRSEYALKYDIENLQRYNKVFEEGEEVVVAEKIHGTFCALAYIPGMNHPELLDGDFFASSKGMLAKGLFMKNNEANKDNLYHRFLLSRNPADDTPMPVVLQKISQYFDNQPVYVFGEIFGKGVQDLSYFLEKPRLEVFDIFLGMPSTGRYLNDDELEYVLRNVANLKRVPVLYRGPFSMEKMVELRDGKSERDGKQIDQIKEGIVIRSVKERENKWVGRVQLKFISPEYLLRKNGTEFN